MPRTKLRVAVALAAAGVVAAGLVTYAEAQNTDTAERLPRVTTTADGFAVEGSKFQPRGNNYVRLADDGSGTAKKYHSNFEPGKYDPARAETALAAMSRDGYNVVRVFIDPGDPSANKAGRPHGLGHGDEDDSIGQTDYYANVADFVTKAAAHKVYVLPALDLVPFNAHYRKIIDSVPAPKGIVGRNAFYMHKGFIKAKAAYVQNFLSQLREHAGPDATSALLGVATDNEATYEGDREPFALTSGKITGPDGLEYDMAVAKDRQQAADASMVVYANTVTAAAKKTDPDVLVTTGMFTYLAVGKKQDGFSVSCSHAADAPPDRTCQSGVDYRYPARAASLSIFSKLSFIDIHLYPRGGGYTVDKALDSSEWSKVKKPSVVGEYGAKRDVFGNDITKAAYGMKDLQIKSCGRGLDGWLFWTWDTDEDATQRLFFRATEAGGAINGQLAPVKRPNPCT
ncbi:hypothetical protein [Stackebrandtia nassauensis]|uniref:Glycoside hydrolase family 5 domain-containing protein n=1 Tax=Stackebrandtia nassauensis (strain DSM 44728 / CIP 108903 / NRRL B-16338 / NBRC 102104 / LLR-40K-21) TaxID=446470 RepID=D3Q165_STANL|nr:hypothetical protein [Stackebrandtia nassauensis]ADD45645.1 hypothetical protein Snas_6020 [Stackebrandtia nassauensis DSM 44728]